MPFLLAEILDFQGSAHLIGVGSLSQWFNLCQKMLILFEFSDSLPWQPICCRIQNHDLPLPLSRHSLLWVLYLRTIKTVRETVNHNCCHVCRRVKKKWIRIHFFVFQSILSKVNSSGYPADHRIPYQYPQPKPYVQPIPLVDDFKDRTDFRSQ